MHSLPYMEINVTTVIKLKANVSRRMRISFDAVKSFVINILADV